MNNQQRKCTMMNIPSEIVLKSESGDAAAQLELGKAYFNTNSVQNNYTLAFDWIHRSAEQDNMEAQFKLGDLCAAGYGIEKSSLDSYKWYTKAAIQGYKRALIRVHNLYQESIKIHCRGKINDERFDERFDEKTDELKLNESIHAIKYYSDQFTNYQSSDQSDVDIQLNLGFLYQHGYGTKKCSRWAFEYYSLAAEQGNVDAQYNLGHLYQQHTEKKFNYRDAFKWYTKSAQGGNIAAQRCLAYFYLKGLATEIDIKTAIYWYTNGAEAGDSQSQVTLGLLYRKGDYVTKNISMAVKWYTLAARQGNIVAQNCLSQLNQRGIIENIELEEDILGYFADESMNNRIRSKLSIDISKLGNISALKQIDRLAKRSFIGDGPAMYEIGLMYYHGDNGFLRDKDTGIKWIKSAAKREHKDAQFMMATLYEEGDSIEQDYSKSVIWYKKIAKKKDSDAQCKVGIMYNEGRGVRSDPLEASKWFFWAADQENNDAQFNIGMLRLYGHGIRRDKTEAEEWFYRSISQRKTKICFEVGELLFTGRIGKEENRDTGLKLLKFAAKHGYVDAQIYLGNYYSIGDDVQLDIQKSTSYYTDAVNSGSGEAYYKLAIVYLYSDDTNLNYMNAYNLLKQAENKGYSRAKLIFESPAHLMVDLKNCSKVINMLVEITRNTIVDFTYQIGNFYELGVPTEVEQKLDINYAEAKKWYLLASSKGDPRADYRLGFMYERKKGVEKNINTAVYYYNKAIEKENCDAMYRLASLYLEGSLINQDLLKAFHLYTKASTFGHKKAMEILNVHRVDRKITVFLNLYYKIDHEIKVDEKTRINMLEKATDEGYTRLQYQLGLMFESNNNELKALKWLKLASELGIADASYRLGVMYEEGKCVKKDQAMAADMYQKASEKDHEDACYRLGQLYNYGNGVIRDYSKVYWFYKKASEMNHEMGSKVLNMFLKTSKLKKENENENFSGFPSNQYQESFTMLKSVAEHGDAEVQFMVGLAYEYNSLEPDYKEAFNWYSIAAKKLHGKATYHLGLLYEKGLGVSQDYKKAIQLYHQANQRSSRDALYSLGTMYHHGKGVQIDPVKAVKYYTLSAKLGNPEYQCELGRLYENGELVQKNILEALKWYTKAYLQGYDGIISTLSDIYEDKPYENFFFEKLIQNLSIASCDHFYLDENRMYVYLGDVNNRLGSLYFFGDGTEKNLKKSLHYFVKQQFSPLPVQALKRFGFLQYPGFSISEINDFLNEIGNDEECMNQLNEVELYLLGMMFYDGVVHTKKEDPKNKFKEYLTLNEKDDNDPSQRILIKKDYFKAINYFNRAADRDSPKARFQLGIMHHYGYGVQKNSDQGNNYFHLAAIQDFNLAGKVALLYHTDSNIQNFPKALEYYNNLEKKLSEDSKISNYIPIHRNYLNTLVQIGIGLLYEYGNGVGQDYQIAIGYYKKLMDKHCPISYLRLGLMYYYGKGVPVDYNKASELFQENFAHMPFNGEFPYVYDQNSIQNTDTSQKMIMHCIVEGEEILGEMYYYLGLIYKYGQGIPKDDEEAHRYFSMAFSAGCKRAKNETSEPLTDFEFSGLVWF